VQNSGQILKSVMVATSLPVPDFF